MKLTLANETDSQVLTEFYQSYPVRGPLEFSVRRISSYFNHYRLQSQDFETHCLRERDGTLEGMATLLFREGRVGSGFETLGYATDLRISASRKAIASWTEHFLPLTQNALEKRGGRFMFSVLSGVDQNIHNTLVRPRAQRRNIPVYHLLKRFEIVTIVGHWPFFYDKLPSVSISRGTEKDLEGIVAYLQKKSAERVMSFRYSAELLQERFQTWRGLKPESFLIAKNRREQIVGITAPWNNSAIQQLIPVRYSGFVQTAKTALKAASFLKMTTPLPLLNTPLKLEFLTHLYADNPDIFSTLLEEAYRRKSPNSYLVYPHFHRFPLTMPPKQFLFSQTPAALYALNPTSDDLPRELFSMIPELELCLV